MKFSYNWLAELVEGLNVGPSELAGLISIKTAESEGAHEWAPWLKSVLAARVEQVAAIEGSKNVLASVETGRFGRKNVVCGAPNCRPGVMTAYVPSGTTLPAASRSGRRRSPVSKATVCWRAARNWALIVKQQA